MSKRPPDELRAGRDLNPDQLRAWLAYIRVNLQLTYEMNHQLLAESELSLSDYHVLSKLHQAPTRKLRIAALAQEIGWERSRASHQVRRMTQRGLISTEQRSAGFGVAQAEHAGEISDGVRQIGSAEKYPADYDGDERQ